MQSLPRISVIIVAFNSRGLIEETLDSVSKQTFRDFETIVVDNASTDGTGELVQKKFPSARYIQAEKNLGFAGGNNLGLKHCRGEYIALLNSDAIAQPDWLEALAGAMDKHPEVGICASKMIASGTGLIDSAGDGFSSGLKGFKRGEGLPSNLYDKEEYIFGACAGAALYRRKMLDEVGFFDEDFFLIQEDTDLNFRAQLAGWKALYVPEAVVRHKVRSSIGHMSDTAVFYALRNSELVRIKDVPFMLLLGALPVLVLQAMAEFFYFAVKHGRPLLFLKAKMDAVIKTKAMLRGRKKVMRLKRVDNRYLRSLMTPVWDAEFFAAKSRKFLFR